MPQGGYLSLLFALVLASFHSCLFPELR